MEKIINDLNYCKDYYYTIKEDSKCCDEKTISYKYLTECGNSAELKTVYEIVMKLFATNYILTVDYICFLNNFECIMNIFLTLKNEEEQFLKHSMYYDDEYLRKMRHLHIFKLYDSKLHLESFIKLIFYDTFYNHSKLLIELFYKLYLDRLIEKSDVLQCFKNGYRMYINLTYPFVMPSELLKLKYESLLLQNDEELSFMKNESKRNNNFSFR